MATLSPSWVWGGRKKGSRVYVRESDKNRKLTCVFEGVFMHGKQKFTVGGGIMRGFCFYVGMFFLLEPICLWDQVSSSVIGSLSFSLFESLLRRDKTFWRWGWNWKEGREEEEPMREKEKADGGKSWKFKRKLKESWGNRKKERKKDLFSFLSLCPPPPMP